MRRRRYYDEFGDPILAKDTIHGKIGGVCAGIARYLDVSTFLVRLVAVIALVTVPQATLLAYGLAYLVMDSAA
ncbi:MAG: PspC domain-containing protein [Pseudomonadales bacterium]|nr:PspC domain-containing protein [Pseudomonadales bacterium]